MMKRTVDDAELWEETLRGVALAVFAEAAAGDHSIDVNEFQAFLDDGWLSTKEELLSSSSSSAQRSSSHGSSFHGSSGYSSGGRGAVSQVAPSDAPAARRAMSSAEGGAGGGAGGGAEGGAGGGAEGAAPIEASAQPAPADGDGDGSADGEAVGTRGTESRGACSAVGLRPGLRPGLRSGTSPGLSPGLRSGTSPGLSSAKGGAMARMRRPASAASLGSYDLGGGRGYRGAVYAQRGPFVTMAVPHAPGSANGRRIAEATSRRGDRATPFSYVLLPSQPVAGLTPPVSSAAASRAACGACSSARSACSGGTRPRSAAGDRYPTRHTARPGSPHLPAATRMASRGALVRGRGASAMHLQPPRKQEVQLWRLAPSPWPAGRL